MDANPGFNIALHKHELFPISTHVTIPSVGKYIIIGFSKNIKL
jgi:hypothetical protein